MPFLLIIVSICVIIILNKGQVLLNNNMDTIFLNNKYTKIYFSLIDKIKQKTFTGFTERHHIVPEHFYTERTRSGPTGWLSGDPDAKENLLDMPAREHAICHLLLRKMVPEDRNAGCVYAAWRMVNIEDANGNRYRVNSRIYARLKEEVAQIHSATMKGRPAHNKGKKEERPDVLDNIKEAAQKRDANKKTCKYCGRLFTPSNYKQYHGDNCEKNPYRDPNIVTVKTRGKKRTTEQKENIRKGSLEFYKENPRGLMKQEHKDKRSKKLKGVKKADSVVANMKKRVQERLLDGSHPTKIRVSCIKTRKEYSLTTFMRYVINSQHGD